jgi:hypothetical protein
MVGTWLVSKFKNPQIPGYLNKLPGFSSIQNITKITAYPGTEYSKLSTLIVVRFIDCQ